MSIGIRSQNSMGYCKLVAGCVGGVGLAVAYLMGAIGPALTAIGAIGCLWAIGSSRNLSGERDLINREIVLNNRGVVPQFPPSSIANNRERIAAQVSGLMIPDMDDQARNAIIETVARIPANEREQVITLASRLIRPQMLDSDRAYIIEAVASIPVNECEQVINLASPLFTQILTDDVFTAGFITWGKTQILGAVARAGNERADRVQRVLHQIPQDLANGLEYTRIVSRIVVILETPLNQPIPALRARMADLAAQGQNAIDVHHGSRDAKTRAAIELLIKQQ
jgi:hypothetical protein